LFKSDSPSTARFDVLDPKIKLAPVSGKNRLDLSNNHFVPFQRGFLPNHKAAGPAVIAASPKDISPCNKFLPKS
jgi:hypothetical protein